MEMKPVGYINSLFTFKNGTPRQPSVCPFARGSLKIDKSIFTNPEHSLEGLEEFSHVWLIFIFHKNNAEYMKAKVKPPRLNGKRVGLFSTRSPYRPNAIGLTLAKLEAVSGSTLHLSGIDLLDGTPVLDIKPYIPEYDSPPSSCKNNSTDEEVLKETLDDPANENQELKSLASDVDQVNKHITTFTEDGQIKEPKLKHLNENEHKDGKDPNLTPENHKCNSEISCDNNNLNSEPLTQCSSSPEVKSAKWISDAPVTKLCVTITERANSQLQKFSKSAKNDEFRLKFLDSADEALEAIRAILCEDPRSIYRRQKCVDNLYYFTVDVLHVTCWFDDDLVEIVRIQPISHAQHLQLPK
ncbi:tRNA (adenine(37)-N6)-methyltransferase-like [Saccostrea echinata]|uniref:tRNA (adenine(37)-N6)-methyltransferase-like n=1 Tax=Saccostrea echinata TaxID=191078 RepID=UPI002A805469|nr:tRNA (adenine(37)-N6)-methyltransferase-like [Saccostrea echinata]